MCLNSFANLFAVTEDDAVIIIGWRDVNCGAALGQLNAWGRVEGNHFPDWLQSTGAKNPDVIPNIIALKSRIMAYVKDQSRTAGTISQHNTVISPNTTSEYADVKASLYCIGSAPCFQSVADANLPLGHLGVVLDISHFSAGWDKITHIGGVPLVIFQDDPLLPVRLPWKQFFR